MHTNESQPSPWHDGERAMQATVGVVDHLLSVPEMCLSLDVVPDAMGYPLPLAWRTTSISMSYLLDTLMEKH